jgi:hypothetical protein
MQKVQELFTVDARRRRTTGSAPASALSFSVVIAALSLAFRDTVTTFLVVWILSFLGLCIARIWSWKTKNLQGASRETLNVSKDDISGAPRATSEMGMVERMLSNYEPSGRRQMTQ